MPLTQTTVPSYLRENIINGYACEDQEAAPPTLCKARFTKAAFSCSMMYMPRTEMSALFGGNLRIKSELKDGNINM